MLIITTTWLSCKYHSLNYKLIPVRKKISVRITSCELHCFYNDTKRLLIELGTWMLGTVGGGQQYNFGDSIHSGGPFTHTFTLGYYKKNSMCIYLGMCTCCCVCALISYVKLHGHPLWNYMIIHRETTWSSIVKLHDHPLWNYTIIHFETTWSSIVNCI